jgi:SAM-dependent methyltransferase
MNFSGKWDQRYRENTHMSVWPWSDVVSLVYRYVKPQGRRLRILELGCGAGANIPFFLSLEADYHAIEGSRFICEELRRRFPQLKDKIHDGDFTTDIPFDGPFDVIVDRSSLTHNTTEAIRQCLALLGGKLSPGGFYLGVDWFSTDYSKFSEGEPAEDVNTRTGYLQGAMKEVGRVHFSDEAHLRDLFRGYEFVSLEHKKIDRIVPEDGWQFAAWNFVAVKSSP